MHLHAGRKSGRRYMMPSTSEDSENNTGDRRKLLRYFSIRARLTDLDQPTKDFCHLTSHFSLPSTSELVQHAPASPAKSSPTDKRCTLSKWPKMEWTGSTAHPASDRLLLPSEFLNFWHRHPLSPSKLNFRHRGLGLRSPRSRALRKKLTWSPYRRWPTSTTRCPETW